MLKCARGMLGLKHFEAKGREHFRCSHANDGFIFGKDGEAAGS